MADEAYQQQILAGKSHEYAKAYASKVHEGEVFARHFAAIREKRHLAKLAKQQEGGAVSPETPSTPSFPPGQLDPQPRPAPAPAAAAAAATPAAAAAVTEPSASGSRDLRKRTPADFIFTKTLGEGSYSTVLLAKERETDKTFAVKILEKMFIKKEKKEKYVMTEKEVFNQLSFSPFIIRLYYTFQDANKKRKKKKEKGRRKKKQSDKY